MFNIAVDTLWVIWETQSYLLTDLLTGAKRPDFSTNYSADTNQTKQNQKQEQHKKLNNHLKTTMDKLKCDLRIFVLSGQEMVLCTLRFMGPRQSTKLIVGDQWPSLTISTVQELAAVV